jgi:hypothetical protein
MCALVSFLLVTAQVVIETPAAATVEERISHINMVSPSTTHQDVVRLRMEAVSVSGYALSITPPTCLAS